MRETIGNPTFVTSHSNMLHGYITMKNNKFHPCLCGNPTQCISDALKHFADVKLILGSKIVRRRFHKRRKKGGHMLGHVIEVLHRGEEGRDRRSRNLESAGGELLFRRIEKVRRRYL